MRKKSLFLLFFFLWSSATFALPVLKEVCPKEKDSSYYLKGGFLYWVAEGNDLYYGQKAQWQFDGSDVVITSMKGDLHKVKPGYEPAFRIGMEYYLPEDKWLFDAEWTRYYSSASDETKSAMITLWGHTSVQIAQFADYGKGNISIQYNQVDIKAKRNCTVGNFLFQPFCGMAFLSLNNNFSLFYNMFDANGTVTNFTKTGSDYTSFGLKGGVDMRYGLRSGFSFYGLFSSSLFYGEFKNRWKTYQDGFLIAKDKDVHWQAVHSWQLGIGLLYAFDFNKSGACRISLGWEENLFLGIDKRQRFFFKLDEAKFQQLNEDLSMQGLVAKAEIDF